MDKAEMEIKENWTTPSRYVRYTSPTPG